jgi:Protein of unknown function (DUF4232)
MKLLSRRPGRRVIAAAALAGAAILVPTVALASAGGGRAAPQVAQCTARNTYVWFADAQNGATGHLYYPVEFTNLGSRACYLYGFPGVQGLTGALKGIGPAASRVSIAHARVTVGKNQTVHATLEITNYGFIPGCKQVTGAGLGVYPPNQKQRQYVTNFTFPACKNKAYLRVYPVQPGIGVP